MSIGNILASVNYSSYRVCSKVLMSDMSKTVIITVKKIAKQHYYRSKADECMLSFIVLGDVTMCSSVVS